MLPADEFTVYLRDAGGVKQPVVWQNYFLTPHRTADTIYQDMDGDPDLERVIFSAFYDAARLQPRCLTRADSIAMHTPLEALIDLTQP